MRRSTICWIAITTGLFFSPSSYAILPTLKTVIEVLEKLVALYTTQGNFGKAQQFLDRINTLRKKTATPN